MKRGAIHWVALDKRRPGIIISPERRNALASDVIIIPCSTQLRAMSWHVLLNKNEGGLEQKCVAKCEQVMTLPKEHVSSVPLGAP